MLGFKLEAPQRDGSATEQVRPIYLDMQVCDDSTMLCPFDSAPWSGNHTRGPSSTGRYAAVSHRPVW